MKVLVADDDATTRLVMRSILEREGYTVTEAVDGHQALDVVHHASAPRILLLDWVMPGLDGIEVCRRIRQSGDPVKRYIMMVTAKNRRQEILEGLGAGADDFMTKPVAPDLLLARLRAAARIVSAGHASSELVREALLEATYAAGGELVVRSGDVVGRIFFHAGRIAWAHISDDPGSLLALLETERGVGQDEVKAVIAECKRTGRNFNEVLIEWGLVDRAQLRQHLLDWITKKVVAMLHFEQAAVMFIPQTRSYSGDLTFALDEVLPEPEAPSVVQPMPTTAPGAAAEAPRNPSGLWKLAFVETYERDLDNVAVGLQEAMTIEGARAVALLDRSSGACLGRAGASMNPDLAWAHIDALNILSTHEQVEDVMVRSDKQSHIVCTVPGAPELFLYLLLSRTDSSVAMARLALNNVARALSAHFAGAA